MNVCMYAASVVMSHGHPEIEVIFGDGVLCGIKHPVCKKCFFLEKDLEY